MATKVAREANDWLRLLFATELLPDAELAVMTDELSQLMAIRTTNVKWSRESQP